MFPKAFLKPRSSFFDRFILYLVIYAEKCLVALKTLRKDNRKRKSLFRLAFRHRHSLGGFERWDTPSELPLSRLLPKDLPAGVKRIFVENIQQIMSTSKIHFLERLDLTQKVWKNSLRTENHVMKNFIIWYLSPQRFLEIEKFRPTQVTTDKWKF